MDGVDSLFAGVLCDGICVSEMQGICRLLGTLRIKTLNLSDFYIKKSEKSIQFGFILLYLQSKSCYI